MLKKEGTGFIYQHGHLKLYSIFLKINKAVIGKLGCNIDIRFYMRGFNYCNN